MNPERRWLTLASGMIWLPLVMAGGSWLLARGIAAPAFITILGLGCVVLSLVFLWIGVAGLMRRTIGLADLLWLLVYGVGAVLYTQLTKGLAP